MKNLLLCLLISGFTVFNLCSQDMEVVEVDTFKRSFGISSSFINTFLPLENSIGSTARYPYHFIKHLSDKRFRKHAIDLNLESSFQNNNDVDDINEVFLSPEYKVAWGWKVPSFKNATFYYGPELLINPRWIYRTADSMTIDNEGNEVLLVNKESSYSLSLMGGPMVGLQYRFGKRFSIYTEAGAYLNVTGDYRIVKIVTDGEADVQFIERELSLSEVFRFPISIILFYDF